MERGDSRYPVSQGSQASPGESKGGGPLAKRDTRLDAIKYQEMLKAQQAKKRATEEQAKEEVDKLSKLVAGLRQMGVQGSEAETEVDKANAALREKDWTRAFNAAEGGITAGQKAAAAAARPQVEAAVQKVHAVENIGVPADELVPLVQEARNLVEEGRYLEALRKAQELRAKALQLGRAQMEEAISSLNDMLEDDRRKGVEVAAPIQLLDKARRLLAGGDVDFNQVIDVITVQAPAARESALRGEAALGAQEGPTEVRVEAEDREAVKRAVEESFRIADEDIATASSLKANVSVAEKELARAKSAFDADDLKAARAGARRSIVAAQMAARKAVLGILQDASQDVRKLRLGGVNVTDPRKNLALAKARLAEGDFRESYGILDELLKRTATMREEQQKIIKEVDSTYDQLLKLTDTLLVPLDAVEALEEARNHARRGDVERAQGALKRAVTAGRDFWSAVGKSVLDRVRDLVLQSREMGGQVGAVRNEFTQARQQLDEGKFQPALNTTLSTTRTLKGVSAAYQEALMLAAMKWVDVETARKLGLLQAADEKALEEESVAWRALTTEAGAKSGEQAESDFKAHRERLSAIRYDFKAEQERFQRLVRRTLDLENEVEEGKKIGTDMTQADELLFNARGQITKRRFAPADELLKQIEADITQRKDARIDELLRDADTDLKHLRAGGVYVEDVEREVREARAQHANRNYEVAVDLIQDAISTALERQQDLEAARHEIERAESLQEQAMAYGADTAVGAGLLDEARGLSREHDDRDARALAAQATGEYQTGLAKYIEIILEEMEKEIDRAESEHGEFPDARQRLAESKRLKDQGEVGEAIVTSREISAGLRQSLQLIQEIRQKIDLVESLIQSASQYSKTVVMPHKLLEHAKERLEHRSLEASREAVNEALQKAEENWRQLLRQVHREAFELIDEFEEKGVQLTAARNMMMQAQGLLETKNFQESHRIAMQAQETGRKSFDIFQRTQRAVGELEDEVEALQGFGVDAAPLTAALERASAAFAAEKYEEAMAGITEAQEVAPALKAKRADELQAAVGKQLQGAKDRKGLNAKRFNEAYEHCLETRKEGDLSLTIEMLLETERDLTLAIKESEAVEGLLGSIDGRLAEFKRIGLDTRGLENGRQAGIRRLDALDLKEGVSLLRRGLKTAEKDAAAVAASKIDAVIQEALAMRLRGYPSEGVIKAAEAGSEALLEGDFARAVAAAAAGADDLHALPQKVDAVRRDASRARHGARLLKDGFGADSNADGAVDGVERALQAGLLEDAEREAMTVLNAVLEALGGEVRKRLLTVDAALKAAESKGAATAPAAEALRLARTALDEGIPEAAAHWAALGGKDAERSVRDADAAGKALDRARAVLADAQGFGAATGALDPKVRALESLLGERRHRAVLSGLAEIERLAAEAKKARVDGRKTEVLGALQRAAKLGLPQDRPRKDLAAAERLAQEAKFDESLRALDALDADMTQRLTRHDEISAQFEAVADLTETFAEMKISFASSEESRTHARAALDKFELKDAEELTQLYRKEVEAILTSHTLSRHQSFVKAAAAARAEGVEISELEEHARLSDGELKAGRHREALVVIDQGFEKLADTRKRFAEVMKTIKDEEAELARAAPLKVDFEESRTALGSARQKVKDGALSEAKVDADYAAGTRRSQVAAEVERRVEDLTTQVEDAAEAGISIESERAGLKRIREAAEANDFSKLIEAEGVLGASLARKHEERRTAVDAHERAAGALAELAELDLQAAEFDADRKALDKIMEANDFKRAAPAADALTQKVAARAKARVEAALAETQAVLKTCAKSKVDAGAALDELARARKLAQDGAHLEAYHAARNAEKAAYEHKDAHDRAKQLLKFLDDNLSAAAALKVDATDVEPLRSQAREAFEFQAYPEAVSAALDGLDRLRLLNKEALEARAQEGERRMEELEMGGASVGSLRKEFEFAAMLAQADDFVSAEVSLSATERRLLRLTEEFAGAKEAEERLSALIDVADLLGVDAKGARKGADSAQDLFDAGKYPDVRRAADASRGDLSKLCAAEVHKRLDAAAKELEGLDTAAIPTGALTDLLERATGEVIDEDFTGAFSTAREVLEGADRQRHAHEAARDAVRSARRLLKVAETLEADAAPARDMVSEAEILFRSGDYAGCESAASQSLEALASAASASAGLAISEAEANLAQFNDSGIRCAPAEDSLTRSREALQLSDYLGSIRFARQAARLGEDARRQMGEAEKLMEEAGQALARAEGLVELGPEERGPLERARSEFESGQMLRASQAARAAREAVDRRAKEAFERTRAEITAVLGSLVKLKGDPGPTKAELAETEKALAGGRPLDALEGAVGARTFAREMLAETIQARTQEAEALVSQVEEAGADVSSARPALETLRKAFEDLDAEAAVVNLSKAREKVDAALKVKAEAVLGTVQRASEHRFLKSGSGAQEVAQWRQATAELKAQLGKGDYPKVLSGLGAALGKVETGIANVVAERLVEIDAIRDAYAGRRDAPEGEQALFDQVAAAADRGRAELADLEAADRLDQALRDAASKFVTESLNNIKREMMTFDDKAAVDKLRALLAAAEKVRGNPAMAVAKTYELLDGARALLTARAEALLKSADRQLEVARAIELDASALQDFADRAHAAIQEGKVTDAIEFADNVLKESARLQDAHVREFLKRVIAEFQAAPDGKAKGEAKRMLEESGAGLKTKDFEASYDFARKALEALINEAREASEAAIRGLLESVALLEGEGVDCSAFREGIEDVRSAFDQADAIAGRKRLSEVAALVKQRHAEWEQASQSLVKLQGRLERASGAKVDVSDLSHRLAEARRKLKDANFAAVKMDADAITAKLNDLQTGKVKALITSAQAKLKHNKNLEIDSRSAEELLGSSQRMLLAKDIDGALDAAMRAIAEADGAKEVTKRVRALGDQGTELLERAAEAGVTLSHEQEQVIFEAAKGRLKPGMKVQQLDDLIQSVREQIGIGGPRLEFSFAFGEPPVVNRTNNAVMEIANRGDAPAADLSVAFVGDASVRLVGRAPSTVEPGERADLELQVLSRRMGDIAVRILVPYKDGLTGEAKRRTDRRWITFFDPTDTTSVDQFVRREEKCLVCTGAIPTTERLKACECQSTFHLHCAAGVKDCPKCGRLLSES